MNDDELISRLNDVMVALSWENVEGAEQQLTMIITELVDAREKSE